jgi:hypothetical protein
LSFCKRMFIDASHDTLREEVLWICEGVPFHVAN